MLATLPDAKQQADSIAAKFAEIPVPAAVKCNKVQLWAYAERFSMQPTMY